MGAQTGIDADHHVHVTRGGYMTPRHCLVPCPRTPLCKQQASEMGAGGEASRWLLVALALLLLPTLFLSAESKCGGAAIFVFGDSNSDTGGLAAGLGFPVLLPSGRLTFHRSTGRLCDGRLILDFLCESLNASYINPYLDPLGNGFPNGANFAVVGSATLPKYRPFSLYIQTLQFLRFRSRALQLVAQGSRGLVGDEGFKRGLYVIDVGQNDLSDEFAAGLSYNQVVARIPDVLSEINIAIKTLYDTGGRNFWVHNTGPLGCLPQKLSGPRRNHHDLDPNGCIASFNNAAKEFNAGLSALCDDMRSALNGATIVYTDIYSIKYDLIANHTRYGFATPLMACCGHGGPPYNYNINITCGNPGSEACLEGVRFVNWDGVHYTETANSIIASKILSTNYSKPKLKIDFFCNA